MRRPILYSALALTIAASVWSWLNPVEDATVAAMEAVGPTGSAVAPGSVGAAPQDAARAPAETAARPQATTSVARPSADGELRAVALRASAGAKGRDLFATHSWYVPPPAPPPAPRGPPPKPTAPPLPFTFLGRYVTKGGSPVYFLARGDRVLDVRAGDSIDGTYRVEGVAGNQLTFTYLPLDERQGLAVGGGS